MNKAVITVLIATVLSAFSLLGLLRLFAPQLLGVPIDLEIVQLSDKVPPFYDVVLNEKEIKSKDKYLKDPNFKHRARPLRREKSIDILGFRNPGVPNKVDVITVGDSQTWGNNADERTNWPGCLASSLRKNKVEVYNASVGGWGAVEYYEIIKKIVLLEPKVVVVAFYAGNDPLDSFMMAYAKDRWKDLRPPGAPKDIKKPRAKYPPPKSDQWPVEFQDGVKTIFTPKARYISNMNHPAVDVGYEVMARASLRITQVAHKAGAWPIFMVIPTKELAFSSKIAKEKIEPDDKYKSLIQAETGRIEELKKRISKIDRASYVDLVGPLTRAVESSSTQYYPRGTDGHPTRAGYRVIANSVVSEIEKHLK